MRFFVDHNLSPQLAKGMKAFGAFFMGGKNRNRCQLIQQLVRNWPRMKELAKKTRVPFAFRVPPSGTKFTTLLK